MEVVEAHWYHFWWNIAVPKRPVNLCIVMVEQPVSRFPKLRVFTGVSFSVCTLQLNPWPYLSRIPWSWMFTHFRLWYPAVLNSENKIFWTKQTLVPLMPPVHWLSAYARTNLCPCPPYIYAHTLTWWLTQILCHLAPAVKFYELFDSSPLSTHITL
jgi:hypothetical protein